MHTFCLVLEEVRKPRPYFKNRQVVRDLYQACSFPMPLLFCLMDVFGSMRTNFAPSFPRKKENDII